MAHLLYAPRPLLLGGHLLGAPSTPPPLGRVAWAGACGYRDPPFWRVGGPSVGIPLGPLTPLHHTTGVIGSPGHRLGPWPRWRGTPPQGAGWGVPFTRTSPNKPLGTAVFNQLGPRLGRLGTPPFGRRVRGSTSKITQTIPKGE